MISKLFKTRFANILDTYYKSYWNNYWVHTNVYYSARPGWKQRVKVILDIDTLEQKQEMKDYFNVDLSTDDEKVMYALRWVIDNIKYTGDFENQKTPEYWQSAYETFKSKKGDCEDGSILIYRICRILGVPSWKLRIVASYVSYNESIAGHAYLCYTTWGNSDISMNWYVIDWCYYPKLSINSFKNISVMNIDMYSPNERSIWWAFNEDFEFAQKNWVISFKKMFSGKTLDFHEGKITGEKMLDKKWYKSKTIWSAIVLAIIGVAQSFGYELPYELIYTITAAFGLYGVRDAIGKK